MPTAWRTCLAAEGYGDTDAMEEADLVILNTCHIREKAAEKVYSELGRVRELKAARAAEGRETRIVVAGCVAQAEGAEILRRAPAVDVVVGPQSYHRLPELLRRLARRRASSTPNFPIEDKFDHLPPPAASQIAARGVSAFLTVQEGCDKFCTFCVVPYTRGAEISRPRRGDRSTRRRGWREAGVREITLIGQNVNAYHGEGPDGSPLDPRRACSRRLADDARHRRACATPPAIPATWTTTLIAAHRRPPGPDALPAPAGAVGLRPRPRRR